MKLFIDNTYALKILKMNTLPQLKADDDNYFEDREGSGH